MAEPREDGHGAAPTAGRRQDPVQCGLCQALNPPERLICAACETELDPAPERALHLALLMAGGTFGVGVLLQAVPPDDLGAALRWLAAGWVLTMLGHLGWRSYVVGPRAAWRESTAAWGHLTQRIVMAAYLLLTLGVWTLADAPGRWVVASRLPPGWWHLDTACRVVLVVTVPCWFVAMVLTQGRAFWNPRVSHTFAERSR